MGYKDGVHDGRESQFQNGFDCGYQQGFQNGFLLGKYNGLRSLAQQKRNKDEPSTSNQANDLILQRCPRGQCVLCTNPTLINDSIKDITEKQSEHMKTIETTLQTRYDHLQAEK